MRIGRPWVCGTIVAVLAAPVPRLAATAPGDVLPAADVLATIPVANEHRGDYDRSLFTEQLDADGDGCPTRAEVLVRDSLTSVEIAGGCDVVSGRWLSSYDGIVITDPGLLEIDHVVALDEAWGSGAWQWDPATRASYANDLDDERTLRAVSVSSNRSKGNADPSNWIPSDPAAVCPFLGDWIAIKARWQLAMDESEAGRIRNLLRDRCPGLTIEPWSPAAIALAPTAGPSGGPATPAIVPLIDQGGGCDPSYPDVCIPSPPPDLDCGDIVERRFNVLPPDPHHFDGNADGVGCEGG